MQITQNAKTQPDINTTKQIEIRQLIQTEQTDPHNTKYNNTNQNNTQQQTQPQQDTKTLTPQSNATTHKHHNAKHDNTTHHHNKQKT